MHDSGKRQEFSTGAVRDTAEGKSRPDLISPIFEDRLGRWLELGAQKYGARNWEKGIRVSRYMASLKRHLNAICDPEGRHSIGGDPIGQDTDDHEAAVAFNIMGITHTREMVRRGLLPAELDDLPVYTPRNKRPGTDHLPVDESGYPIRTFENQDREDPVPPERWRIYVAGPYSDSESAVRAKNRRKAANIGLAIFRRGHIPHVPHCATGDWEGDLKWRHFMAIDKTLIEHWATHLFFIGESPGANLERAWAEKRGLPVLTNMHDIPMRNHLATINGPWPVNEVQL